MSNHLSVFSCLVNCEPVESTRSGAEIAADVPESFETVVDRLTKQSASDFKPAVGNESPHKHDGTQGFEFAGRGHSSVVIRNGFPLPLEHTIFGQVDPAAGNDFNSLSDGRMLSDSGMGVVWGGNHEPDVKKSERAHDLHQSSLGSVHRWVDAEHHATEALPIDQVALVVQASANPLLDANATIDVSTESNTQANQDPGAIDAATSLVGVEEFDLRERSPAEGSRSIEALLLDPVNVWSASTEVVSVSGIGTDVPTEKLKQDPNGMGTRSRRVAGSEVASPETQTVGVSALKASAAPEGRDGLGNERTLFSNVTAVGRKTDSPEPVSREKLAAGIEADLGGDVGQSANDANRADRLVVSDEIHKTQGGSSQSRPAEMQEHSTRPAKDIDQQKSQSIELEPEAIDSGEVVEQLDGTGMVEPSDGQPLTGQGLSSQTEVASTTAGESLQKQHGLNQKDEVFKQVGGQEYEDARTVDSDIEPVVATSSGDEQSSEMNSGNQSSGHSEHQVDIDIDATVRSDGESRNQILSFEKGIDAAAVENGLATEGTVDVADGQASESLSDRLYDEILNEASQSESIKKTSQTVRDAMASSLRMEGKTVQVELHPAELGALKIQVTQNDNSMEAQIVASESMTSDLLNSHREQLMEILSELGFESTDVNITHEDESRQEFQQSQDQPPTPYQTKPKTQPVQNQSATSSGGVNIVA